MKYELWANENKTSLSFIGVNYPNYGQNLKLLEDEKGNFQVIWTVEAETYNEAMQKYYDYMGWEKYIPMEE